MAEPIEIFRYIRYLRLRWVWIAVSAGVAVVLAAGISLLLTRQYTATARILIEPPAGGDPRSATALSPVYLESLKTYETFAAGDSLFERAENQFGLRTLFAGQALESMKKRVLKVALVRNTRILEVSATLPDARKAQALAQFLAEATVDLTRTVVSEGDRDLTSGIEKQEQAARERSQASDEAWAKAASAEPITELQAEMESGAELRSQLRRELANSELLAADGTDSTRQVTELRKQIHELDQRMAERERMLAQRTVHRERLDAERKQRQAELAAAEARLNEARGFAGYRGERMKLIDPGVVPQRPSSPNVMLNILAALLLGLLLPVLYLAIEMNYQEQRIIGRRGAFPEFVRSADE